MAFMPPPPVHFNPHSPCGERPYVSSFFDGFLRISIHTPLAGSDPIHFTKLTSDPISIHTPLAGSDFDKVEASEESTVFQSTLPLRGATAEMRHF